MRHGFMGRYCTPLYVIFPSVVILENHAFNGTSFNNNNNNITTTTATIIKIIIIIII